MTLVFNVNVPATTGGNGRNEHVAGTLDRLDGGLPQWNPGEVVLTRVDATHCTITLTGQENTHIKYTLGDWDYVERDASYGKIATGNSRFLTKSRRRLIVSCILLRPVFLRLILIGILPFFPQSSTF